MAKKGENQFRFHPSGVTTSVGTAALGRFWRRAKPGGVTRTFVGALSSFCSLTRLAYRLLAGDEQGVQVSFAACWRIFTFNPFSIDVLHMYTRRLSMDPLGLPFTLTGTYV